jgi:tRNA-specific 2-thiouridylase
MKAIVLLSGGLDSSLALKLIANQGIETIALHFSSPFCCCDGSKGCGYYARSLSEVVGCEYKHVHLGQQYLDMIAKPKHGYGKNLNPCIDCRIQKFAKAKELMEETGSSFIVTGEVLGQRPMSQHKRAMEIIEKESGLDDLIVRPLSAKQLPPSLPERNGWVERELFMAFQGRGRKPQMSLAQDLGLNEYPCPAGGCLLTVSSFAPKVKDLMDHKALNLRNVNLLKIGRHFKLSPASKLIVGKDQEENQRLTALRKEEDLLFEPVDIPGPTAIGTGPYDETMVHLAARIIARYISSEASLSIKVHNGDEVKEVSVVAGESNNSLVEEYRAGT